ncbi:MAG TPA: hypothetical protein VFS20_04205 [Longimicrobium sp.]|nr:hypothetical protein [Longimicrobium sp.]
MPAERPQSRLRRALTWAGYALALAACAGLSLLSTLAELDVSHPDVSGLSADLARSYLYGHVMGSAGARVFFWLLLSALFLGWSRKSRPFIPLLAVVFAIFSTFSALAKRDQREQQRVTVVRGQGDSLGSRAAKLTDSVAPAAT